MTDAHLPNLDADHLDDDDRLAIAQVRYLVSLVVLPYVSQHLGCPNDLGAVVDDVTRRLHRVFQPGEPLDVAGFIRGYVATVEDTAHGSSSQLELEWVWTKHATAIRQWTQAH